MNTETHEIKQQGHDLTKSHDLRLIIGIDNTGWSCSISSSLGCIPDRGEYRYSFKNGSLVDIRGHRTNDTDVITDVHAFNIESFRGLATIYSQGTTTCQYTLIFRDDYVQVIFQESLKKRVWEGILKPGEECIPRQDSPTVHPMVYQNFDVDMLSEIFHQINEDRFLIASTVDPENYSGYAM